MKKALMIVAATLLAATAAAQQYKWVDENGRVRYGDTPPPGVKATPLKGPSGPSAPAAATKGEKDKLSPEAAFRKRQEDAANKVERQVRKAAAALYLSDHIGERFDAVVTGASPKGTWVRLTKPPVEGRLERGFQGLDVGDRIRVQLISTNAEKGFIDFARV